MIYHILYYTYFILASCFKYRNTKKKKTFYIFQLMCVSLSVEAEKNHFISFSYVLYIAIHSIYGHMEGFDVNSSRTTCLYIK